MSRLTIDMTDQQHQSLKALAALQGKTIKQYALDRLFPGDAEADQAMRHLGSSLEIASMMGFRRRCRPRASAKFSMKNSARITLDGLRSHNRGRS